VIQTQLKDRLAEELLFGKLTRGGSVRVDVGEGEAERKLIFEIEAAP
jgi:ATP-dependent Clp protease ATP-binding subunit ClpA